MINGTLTATAECLDPSVEDINEYNYIVKMLLAIYLLVGNVMLLNLLIAIFT